MGLDGFAMGNLGLNAELTSAQMANQAEQIAAKEFEIKIKDVTGLAEDGDVKRKEENEEENAFDDGFEKRKKNKNKKNTTKEEDDLIDKKFGNTNPKDFSLRINYNDELIELYNNKEESVLETIRAEDLISVVSKLDNASGILVNRKI
ncbi:MAG: hypothetical protein PHC64_06860 [Candidatus Gastranaerophilales bacterium]|nr:hypothetical protein [Candidatus Gastranaerophilales bacterium]